MTAPQLLAWLLALPPILDGAGHNIPRPETAASVIAAVAAETESPVYFAAALDVFAALESGYRPRAAGDCPGMRAGSPQCTRALGAKSCGAWQTPCSSTSEDPATQARQWVAILRRSMVGCPEHPLSLLGTGRCQRWAGGDRRAALIAGEIAAFPAPPKEGS